MPRSLRWAAPALAVLTLAWANASSATESAPETESAEVAEGSGHVDDVPQPLGGENAESEPPAGAAGAHRPARSNDEGATVRAVRTEAGWQLLRNGEPYAVIGAGFGGDIENLDLLAAAGANSIRTWSTEDAGLLLDEAMDRGMTVMLGVWLGHASHGFDYEDPEQVATQLAEARRAVTRYRNHPALLAWGVGNEMEMGNDTPALWAAVEDVAAMIQEVDPNHPTVVVTAELGEANDARIRELAPSIDIWGINSYNGIYSLAERLSARGWDGPILITEFGQGGGWEVAKTDWGAPVEANSRDRAHAYREAWNAVTSDPRSLGGYAFHWGNNTRPLDTWYALLTPTGGLTEAALALYDVWGGTAPEDAAPRFDAWTFSHEGQRVAPGEPLSAALEASHVRPLRYTWVVHQDSLDDGSGAGTPLLCASEESERFVFDAPLLPGPYRVLGVARDAQGGAAMASGRFFVEGDATHDAPLPFRVDDHFASSGWMGDAAEDGVTREDCDAPVDYCSDACHAFRYRRRSQGWAGVIWHAPVGNWDGSQAGVRVPPGAVAVEFEAWGEDGRERVSFFAGNREAGEPYGALEEQRLRDEPRSYRIELEAGTSEDVTAAFSWVAAAQGDITFYVRGIRWVAE